MAVESSVSLIVGVGDDLPGRYFGTVLLKFYIASQEVLPSVCFVPGLDLAIGQLLPLLFDGISDEAEDRKGCCSMEDLAETVRDVVLPQDVIEPGDLCHLKEASVHYDASASNEDSLAVSHRRGGSHEVDNCA